MFIIQKKYILRGDSYQNVMLPIATNFWHFVEIILLKTVLISLLIKRNSATELSCAITFNYNNGSIFCRVDWNCEINYPFNNR